MVDVDLVKIFELEGFENDLNNKENYYLNLIYNSLIDEVQEKWVYEKTSSLMEWNCAICGTNILIDKLRNDVENFVCDKCVEKYNNTNDIVDNRILKSRNRMYKYLEDKLYEILEDKLKGGIV